MLLKKDDLPKIYSASKIEDKIYKNWEKSGCFKPNMNKKESFCITMPPPNATGTLHLGHATMLAFEDVMIRYNRMLGKSTLWLPGTDHAAIATQSVVEKKLIESGIEKPRKELGRDGLIDAIKKFVDLSQDKIRNQVKKMGSSCDWSREKYTLDDDLNIAVNTFFKAMYDDGLIYKGNRIVNWDPNMKTTVADDEIEYHEETSKFYYFQYGPVVIGTARPETKFLDKIIVVHPDDNRYKDLVGKEFDVEWIEGAIKARVIADQCIDMELGTGAMTITPAHSLVDFELAERHSLDVEQIIDLDGNIRKEVSSLYGGMSIKDARKKIVETLDKKGLLVEIDEKYKHKKATNYRGDGLIEPQVMKQWFVDVNKRVIDWKGKKSSLKEVLQDVIKSEMICILPNRFEKTYFNWIDNLKDWCISRQIWWGHQIPIWYQLNDEAFSKYSKIKNPTSYNLQSVGGEIEAKCSNTKPNGDNWVRDPDTLDTWFSSSLWTFSTLGWPEKTEDLKRFHPTTVMETGYDIIFFWVARMILASTYIFRREGVCEEDCVPFKTVYLHGLIRDKEGKKMSKSRPETCIDPLKMIEQYGADALRLSLLIGSSPGNDMRLYEEKIGGYRNFVNKIWNISRYVLMSTKKSGDKMKLETSADYWIIYRLECLKREIKDLLDRYLFSHAGERVYNFLWGEFADWYIEVSKIEGNKDVILRHILKESLKLLHPFVPFITEYIWKLAEFSQKQLIEESWPIASIDKNEKEKEFEELKLLISRIRSERSYFNIEPKIFISIVVKKGVLDVKNVILKKLARVQTIKKDNIYIPGRGDVFISVGSFDIYLQIAEYIDIDSVLDRMSEELVDIEKLLNIMESKLSNKKFMDNAPKNIVDEQIKKRDDLKQKCSKLKLRIKEFNI